MQVSRPIFLVGTGRTGSTLLFQLLSHHPNTSWLSRLCVDHPRQPGLHRRAMERRDRPWPMGRSAPELTPMEGWEFWDAYDPGFSLPFRDLTADDVRPRTRRELRGAVGELLTAGRPRFLAKITGWPRLGWLDGIFDDALFVHVLRDGRAVANSLLQVPWWHGWRGPWNWRWGPLSPDHQREWEESGKSFVVLAAIQWKILMDAMDVARRRVDPGRFHEVRYEDLCADPAGVLARLRDFCQLPRSAAFDRTVAETTFRNANGKWTKDLTPAQQEILNASLRDCLVRYGFEGSGEGVENPGRSDGASRRVRDQGERGTTPGRTHP